LKIFSLVDDAHPTKIRSAHHFLYSPTSSSMDVKSGIFVGFPSQTHPQSLVYSPDFTHRAKLEYAH
jgi:hypothetical protein